MKSAFPCNEELLIKTHVSARRIFVFSILKAKFPARTNLLSVICSRNPQTRLRFKSANVQGTESTHIECLGVQIQKKNSTVASARPFNWIMSISDQRYFRNRLCSQKLLRRGGIKFFKRDPVRLYLTALLNRFALSPYFVDDVHSANRCYLNLDPMYASTSWGLAFFTIKHKSPPLSSEL
jgi:hypothetical protein